MKNLTDAQIRVGRLRIVKAAQQGQRIQNHLDKNPENLHEFLHFSICSSNVVRFEKHLLLPAIDTNDNRQNCKLSRNIQSFHLIWQDKDYTATAFFPFPLFIW